MVLQTKFTEGASLERVLHEIYFTGHVLAFSFADVVHTSSGNLCQKD